MRKFQIRPINPMGPSVEIIAHDASPVLNLVHRLGCGDADVSRDGHYSFSVRLECSGFWCIYQRSPVFGRTSVSDATRTFEDHNERPRGPIFVFPASSSNRLAV